MSKYLREDGAKKLIDLTKSEIKRTLDKQTYDASYMSNVQAVSFLDSNYIKLEGTRYIDCSVYIDNLAQGLIAIRDADKSILATIIARDLIYDSTTGTYKAHINLSQYPTAYEIGFSKKGYTGDSNNLYAIFYNSLKNTAILQTEIGALKEDVEELKDIVPDIADSVSDIKEYGVEVFVNGQVATPNVFNPYIKIEGHEYADIVGYIANHQQYAVTITNDDINIVARFRPTDLDIDENGCYHAHIVFTDYPTATRLYVSKGDDSHNEFCKVTCFDGYIKSKDLQDGIKTNEEGINALSDNLEETKANVAENKAGIEGLNVVTEGLDERVKVLEGGGYDLKPYGEGGLSNGSANELSAKFLTEEFDPSRNWYIEFVAKVNTTRNNKIFAIDWGKNKNFAVIYFRNLHGPQFTLNDTTYANFQAPISWTNYEYAHYMLAKNETGISLFCNGILLHTVEYTATYSPSINKLHIALYTNNNFKLFRIGYYEVFDSLVAHYNNGNPFAFVEDNSNMIAEFLSENLTKTKTTNTANGILLEYEEGKYEPITDNPWANPIKAEGSPVNVPLYAGQHYLDTITNIMYEAIGNTQVTDWKKIGNTTFDDLDNLKEEIIEIGDKRWSGGSGGGSTAVVVTDYYKDGITEDSDAIEAAIEAAKNFGKVLYFPKGTYKLRRSIQLWDNAVIDGDKGAVLTHKAVDGNGCIMTTLSSATVIGDTTISVSSVAGLSVGDEIVIYDTTSGLSSYQETMCKITAINGNTLTIDATQWHGSVGVRRAYPVNNTRITTDFALIHTPWVDGAHNCVIRNITLQANGNNNEPYVYSQSPIHIHSKNAYDISIKNIVVDGSVNDGISIQGSRKQRVIGCTIKGIKWKGVHWGTTSADVLVERCWFETCGLVASDGNAYNSGGGAIYSCYNNHKLRIVNNHITDCLRGVFGLDVQNSNSGEDGSWIVSGNVFDTPKNFTNRAGLGISVGGSNNGLITNNVFCRFGKNSTPITIDNSEDFGGNTFAVTISNNTLGHWQSNYVGDDNKGAIYVKGATKCIVNGNNIDNHYHDYGGTAAPTEISGNTNIIVDSCTKCVVTNNIVAGGKVEEKNTNTGCVIANNVVDIIE